MNNLTSAHKGYEYQDLLVACRLVDVLLGNVSQVYVDEKFFNDDRFDDLTTIDIRGHCERIQFKHTDNDHKKLTCNTFTNDNRQLKLNQLIASMVKYHACFGRDAHTVAYRIVLRDQVPDDLKLLKVLKTCDPDPGAFFPGMQTVRLSFDSVALWEQREGTSGKTADRPFSFLFTGDTFLQYEELKWACEHLIVELGAPPMSSDLMTPDLAEKLLLTRVRTEVGAESFPNAHRSAVDVAAAMISTARAARQGLLEPTVEELLRRSQLQSDFGAVSRAHPVDQALEVSRPNVICSLVKIATELAGSGDYLLIKGPPGHGKSWVCQQLLDTLLARGWLTAEHYCYLGDADSERQKRVLSESVFGSLVRRLADADSRLGIDHRPKLAANEDVLVEYLQESTSLEPNRKIALVIDGIDHITRLLGSQCNSVDPSRDLSESFSALALPPGVVVIILSQPGLHLEPLEVVGAKSFTLPGLNEQELRLLAEKLNIIPGDEPQQSTDGLPVIEDAENIDKFLEALTLRSKGNALYATYLCRETMRRRNTIIDPETAVLNLPSFDGSLENYYDHLYKDLGDKADWVADLLALVDFSLTRADLCEIKPDRVHHVDKALSVLEPVLREQATQGGVRIYHESFARYLRKRFEGYPDVVTDLLKSIADWLMGKGIFTDSRAFHSLLSILSEAKEDARIVDLVDNAFVTRAVAAGYSSPGIIANLATAICSAARLENWPAVVRYVELSRAAHSYQRERFDSTLVNFVDVPAKLLGANILASRLVDEDCLVMSAREGLQMCAALDALGATVPWHLYMNGYIREAKTDHSLYGKASDYAVNLAWLRGELRLSALDVEIDHEIFSKPDESNTQKNIQPSVEWNPTMSIDWASLAQRIENADLPASKVVNMLVDTRGVYGVLKLIDFLEHPGDVCLALAERLTTEEGAESEIGSPLRWAIEAVRHGTKTGTAYRLVKLGFDPEDLTHSSIEEDRERLLNLTRQVQKTSITLNGVEQIEAWIDACTIAAHRDTLGITAVEALITNPGWYGCWLRFVLGLSRAEAAEPAKRGFIALEALRLLTAVTDPFSGDPRACDLYSLHGIIRDTIRRAVNMFDDSQWDECLSLLKAITASVTVTIKGELGGPVPPDFILSIVVNSIHPTRQSAVDTFIQDVIDAHSSGRFYSDLAESKLFAARLAIAGGDIQRAQTLWEESCAFLTAYGWHKDITVFEVLDPLPTLIEADPARGRVCVAAVQGLCERVPLHTDGKETRHAWPLWWKLLVKADPVAAIHLAVPKLLAECNDSNSLLNDMLEDVWQEWHEQVDPLLSGALRLTLDMPLDSGDTKQLERLANGSNSDETVSQRLMTWLLARADERPVTYGVSNSAELIVKDDKEVAKLNEIAEPRGLPLVGTIRDGIETTSNSHRNVDVFSKPITSVATNVEMANIEFPPGFPGLSCLIRAWQHRPYDSLLPMWEECRFANLIGYRLIELAEEGHYKEAVSAIKSFVRGSMYMERSSVLRQVAEGLDRYGQAQLAAVAYALTWTSSRGKGGWLTFGGETDIDALQRATELDSQIACDIVAEQIGQVIASSSYEIYGISQALIQAFAVGALVCPGRTSLDIAFAAWKEAFGVIDARAPRVEISDDPNPEYEPPNPDSDERVPGDLQAAMVLATLGGLAHPGREKKRRTYLAVQLLLEELPEIAAPAFDIALGQISDAATLTWLLQLIDSSGDRGLLVRRSCQATLRDLVSRNLLTVRAIARRLLMGDNPPIAPISPAHSALLSGNQGNIWIPENFGNFGPEESEGLDGLLENVAGTRLKQGEQLLYGFRRAVRALSAKSFNHEEFTKRLNSQLDSLANRSRKRWPDAFLASEETIEKVLQSVAVGGRAARLMNGNPISDPVAWEDKLASALLNDPAIPLTLEAIRQPRPNIAPPPYRGHEVWTSIQQRAAGVSSSSVVKASVKGKLLSATLTTKAVNSAAIAEERIFGDWRWLATMETRFADDTNGIRQSKLFSKRYCVLEVRNVGDSQGLTVPPVTYGDLRMWQTEVIADPSGPFFNRSQSLVGEDFKLAVVGDGGQGLGVPRSLLTPTASLIAMLKLHPRGPFCFVDENGLALALVIWRAEYDTSDYYLTWPRICGSGIMIRSDLLDRLVSSIGEHRLIFRDFVVGNYGLLSPNTPRQ